LVKFRKEQEQRTTTSSEPTFLMTGTENWSDEEVNKRGHNNSTFSAGLSSMIGMQGMSGQQANQLTNYSILSLYVDSGNFGSTGVANGTRNGLDMANTVANQGDAFIGRELMSKRGDGAHFEYNKNYGFLTYGSFKKEPVKGNPDLEGDFVKFKARDLMRTTPGLSEADATTQAQGILAQNNPPINGGDVFTLVTQNTRLGEGGPAAETQQLKDRYKRLLVQEGGMSQEQANAVNLDNVTLGDFYALQYNASAAGGKYPKNQVAVDSNGHVAVQGIKTRDGKVSRTAQQGMEDVMNLRVVAETNFGRRTGEGVAFGPGRINRYAESHNMSARLDETDAANMTGSVDQLDKKLESVGLTSADGILTRSSDGQRVNLVPEGLRDRLKATMDANPALKAANQSFYKGLTSVPAVVTVADAQSFGKSANAANIEVRGLSRITQPMNIQTITAQEWQTILPGMVPNDGPSADGRSAERLARDGQFVVGSAGTTTTTRTQTPEVEVRASEMLQLADGKAPQAKVDSLKASLGITGEISQQDLFKRVLTDAFGQSTEQATTALSGAQGPTAKFSFPSPAPAANSGVQFAPPDPAKPTELVKTESSTVVSGPSVESRTASLNTNLKTMGELAQIKQLIPKDPAAIGALKTQILADLTALEGTPPNPNATVKIGTPPTDTPISTIRASVTESFGKIEASVADGTKALRAQALRSGLSEDADPAQVLGATTTGGLPPIPPVPADGKAGGAAYATSIQDSVKAFSGQLREMVRDGDISETEKASIQGWLDTSTQNLATSLGLPPNTLQGSNLAETLRGKGYSDADINTISNTVELIKDAQASTNLTSEARSFHKVLDNVRGLQQKLDEFEKVGVLRNAFVGEMKDLATKKPDQFDAVMRSAYNLPPKGQDPKADAVIADLTTQAKEGRMPIPANISFVDGDTLHGANAAYIPPQTGADGKKVEGTILLNRALLTKPAELSNALAEEMFHHMEGQTQAFRAEEALGKLPADAQTTLKAKPDAVLSDEQIAALTTDQKKTYDDYLKARSGTYDTVGDEGQAGLRAFREAQQGGSVATISAVAAQGRDALASEGVLKSGTGDRPTDLKGYDHGTVTLRGLGSVRAEFQSGGVRRGGSTDTQAAAPPITPGETGGLATPGINPHNTGKTYVMPTKSDPMPPTSDPAEIARRDHIKALDQQLSTFQTTEHKNADGSPMTEPQKEQKRLNLQNKRDELVQMNPVQYAQQHPENIPASNGSTHQMEQPPEDFWGKAKEMGGQAINGILQALSTGAFGALCDKIADQIESVWSSFYGQRSANSIASDNTKATELAGVTMGEGARSSDNLSKSAQGQHMLNESMDHYQKTVPGLIQKSALGRSDDADERHRQSFNGVFNR
jgi:hypothetical protein